MEVILLQDVDKVGLRGEVVSVARGFARNYLLPRKLAETATTGQGRRARAARGAARPARGARRRAGARDRGRLEKTELRFDVKAGPTGSLFGSVTPTDVADELWRKAKIRVDRRKIDLAEPIKRIGRYSVPIDVFPDVRVEVKTLVVPEGGELPPEEELEAAAAAEAAAAEEAAAASEQAAAELAEILEHEDVARGRRRRTRTSRPTPSTAPRRAGAGDRRTRVEPTEAEPARSPSLAE